MRLSLENQRQSCWTGVDRHLVVHVFEGHLSIADMDSLDAFGERWMREATGKLVELSIVFPSRAVMSSEERKRIGVVMRRLENDRIASAIVILADGLLGAMQRSVLTGLLLIAPPQHPQKVFGTIDPALRWLMPYLREANGADAAEAQLRSAIDQLCSDFMARSDRAQVT